MLKARTALASSLRVGIGVKSPWNQSRGANFAATLFVLEWLRRKPRVGIYRLLPRLRAHCLAAGTRMAIEAAATEAAPEFSGTSPLRTIEPVFCLHLYTFP